MQVRDQEGSLIHYVASCLVKRIPYIGVSTRETHATSSMGCRGDSHSAALGQWNDSHWDFYNNCIGNSIHSKGDLDGR